MTIKITELTHSCEKGNGPMLKTHVYHNTMPGHELQWKSHYKDGEIPVPLLYCFECGDKLPTSLVEYRAKA